MDYLPLGASAALNCAQAAGVSRWIGTMAQSDRTTARGCGSMTPAVTKGSRMPVCSGPGTRGRACAGRPAPAPATQPEQGAGWWAPSRAHRRARKKAAPGGCGRKTSLPGEQISLKAHSARPANMAGCATGARADRRYQASSISIRTSRYGTSGRTAPRTPRFSRTSP